MEMFTWHAQEFKNFTKNNDWFWTIGLIAIVGAGLAIWRGSISFAILIMVIGFTLIVFGNRTHPEHSILINDDGLMIDEKRFLWKDVKGFRIIDDPKNPFEKKLLLATGRQFADRISLPIDRNRVNPDTLRDFLKNYTEEDLELRESLSKYLAEQIRF